MQCLQRHLFVSPLCGLLCCWTRELHHSLGQEAKRIKKLCLFEGKLRTSDLRVTRAPEKLSQLSLGPGLPQRAGSPFAALLWGLRSEAIAELSKLSPRGRYLLLLQHTPPGRWKPQIPTVAVGNHMPPGTDLNLK